MRTTTLRRPTKAAVALLMSSGLLLAGTSGASAVGLSDITGALGGELGSLGSLDVFGSLAPQLPPTARLEKVSNFRDVAGNEGAGYSTNEGRHMQRGVFYRSNALKSATDADLATLTGLGVTKVYDLRGIDEIAIPQVGGENKIPAGAEGVAVPIDFGDLVTLAQQFQSPDESRAFMRKANEEFVTDAIKRGQFATVLTDLANGSDPQIFNCTSGKDRTGWTAMLLQSIAGLSDQAIMDDYLLSNEYLKESNAQTIAYIKLSVPGAGGEFMAANLAPMLDVETGFLQAGLNKIAAEYGTVQGYLKTGLGLSDATIGKLKHKLVA